MCINEMVAVLQHYENGGEVECQSYRSHEWKNMEIPTWNFDKYYYRIKKTPKTKMVYEWFYQGTTTEKYSVADYLLTEEEATSYYKNIGIKHYWQTGRSWEVPND